MEQKGGGAMIPIVEEKETNAPSVDRVNVKLVSPVEAATQRVESSIKRIKRKRKRKTVSRGVNSRKGKTSQSKKRKTRKRNSAKQRRNTPVRIKRDILN
ncbi:MAG: hypothetical protein ABW185_07320 [Sedimenticola sp.]